MNAAKAFFISPAYFELQVGYMENLADNITHRIIYLSPELYFTQTLFNLSRGHPILDKQVFSMLSKFNGNKVWKIYVSHHAKKKQKFWQTDKIFDRLLRGQPLFLSASRS